MLGAGSAFISRVNTPLGTFTVMYAGYIPGGIMERDRPCGICLNCRYIHPQDPCITLKEKGVLVYPGAERIPQKSIKKSKTVQMRLFTVHDPSMGFACNFYMVDDND